MQNRGLRRRRHHVAGSITLAHAVLAAGLVDEIRLLIHPAVQGRGKDRVAEGTSFPRLELLELRALLMV
ncbi:MAG TPA: dihydrofolate reductase family protein [Nocardioides sp.]|nr:dihydrofolate reductase family protein [Nocardioides sp.]